MATEQCLWLIPNREPVVQGDAYQTYITIYTRGYAASLVHLASFAEDDTFAIC